jgi:hypothetical protein
VIEKGNRVRINCTDAAGQQGGSGVVIKTDYGSDSRFHIGVKLDDCDEVHWHETACLTKVGSTP